MDEKLFKRDIFEEIVKYLDTENIIVLRGARQVGKTRILYYLENYLKEKGERTYFFDLEDSRFIEILDEGVDSFLNFLGNEGFDLEELKTSKKRLYVFIDEVQYMDKPSPFLKLLIDHHSYIQLVVSGSSSFDIKSKFSDSLVGRTVAFEIFNLSFKEFLRFKGFSYNLKEKPDSFHLQKLIDNYKEYVYFGGYPKVVLETSVEIKEKYLQGIIDTYIKKDVRDLAKITDTKKFNDLLKVLASQSGNLLNVTEISNITGLAVNTINEYLFILENTYVIKLVPPFSSSARVELVKTPKIFFYDTGLLQMLWFRTIGQKIILGNIFETSVFAELCKKYGPENVNFWRTKNQTEIDFILNYKDKILPVEVKENFGAFKPRVISFFCKKYKTKEYRVVGLAGKKVNTNYIYPWEI